jgi:hypothetical protein
VGKDAIRVRKERNSHLSFDKIQDIQASHILKGEEGTDWYESGWHRERLGRIKKLLAYTPVRFNKGMSMASYKLRIAPQSLGVGVTAPSTRFMDWLEAFRSRWIHGRSFSF